MSRFIFYLILVNLITNMIAITPRILIIGSKSGTVLAIVLALVIGMVLTYTIVRLFSQFPGQGLPEIMKKTMPKWISTPILLFFSLAWYFAGLIVILIYTVITIRFLTPEMPIFVIFLAFLLIVTYGVYMSTDKILYFSEIVFIISMPFIFFVLLKGYASTDLNWDYIRVAALHINHLPNYTSFSTSLYIVIGAANLVIFNRYFTKPKKPTGKGMALLTLICTFILLTTYFLPIGFGGFDSLDNVLFPWITTSDSIRMKFGIVERIVFLFIGFFFALGVVSTTTLWHVSMQLLSSTFYFKRFKFKSFNLTLPFFMFLFWIVAMYTTREITIDGLFKSVEFFDKIFLPILLVLLIGSLLLAKRRGSASTCPKSKK
ncbi:GerAB/ArcD/ProY family transporter [Lederbergia lenta]|uniref:Spore germination protein n=1 Tax=Lederbergia lenta TaxID=1467 RepID=A0A2X4VJW7_LEDLE|nr:GerAB/ArcD/ProY family transporter [Lederbergia lenta]MEC2323617.1 GerAB/ArcD/ProY family transporter [Lederbergia lenta]SQI52447.1 spore germination protein [Lederbergia lenta]